MKIRTIENLVDALSEDLSWRKQELSIFFNLIQLTKNDQAKTRAMLRSSLAILYAHWEGFIKLASTSYLEYVYRQAHKNKELKTSFVAASSKSALVQYTDSKKYSLHIKAIDGILSCQDEKCNIPYNTVVQTRSNLNSSVLKEIITLLSLDYSPFETKEKLIDYNLLYYRNNVAHGKGVFPSLEQYTLLYRQILTLMEQYRTIIENAAILKQYLKINAV